MALQNELIIASELANEFNQTGPLITINLGNGLVKNAVTGDISVLLATTTQTTYVETLSGGANTTTAGVWNRGCTVTRTNVGRWSVVFTTPHPDGIEYNISLSVQESGTLRDVPKISIVQGTKSANGFSIQITLDDNGANADTYNDSEWSFGVCTPVTVITGITPL